MQTQALRLYGKNDLRLERFELPELGADELLADITTNSICMSDYKLAIQGDEHKRVPRPLAEHPIILGHEFCGTILQVGEKLKGRYAVGSKYTVQPAFNYPGRELEAPGYSFPSAGGHATKIIIPREAMEMNCVLPFSGEGFFNASLSEPVSCIIGAFNTNYHFRAGSYQHEMGIVEGGAMVILAGAGPMGLGAIDYAVNGPRQPRLLVVTDIDDARLNRAAAIFTPQAAKARGVDLRYVNTSGGSAVQDLLDITGGKGFDDTFVFAPVPALIEQGSAITGYNGCINFFAGPSKSDFKATINFYDIHYSAHHVVGSSGGNTDDMREALDLMAANRLTPAVMITHIGGINASAETTLNLPKIPGGKKLIYTTKSLPLTALDDFAQLGATNPFFAKLAAITQAHNGLWSLEAEKYLLQEAPSIELR